MGRAEQAGSVLPEVARLAAEHAPALTRAFHILDDGALVGPAADKLFHEMSQQHQTVRSGFLHAFEQVRALATQAKHGPPRVSAPHLAGAPSSALRTGLGLLTGGLRASGNTVGGDPNKLHQLGLELARAGRSWENAGQRLGSILGGLGLDGGAGKTISRAGGWVAGQQREVNHRRNELLQSDALNAGLGMLTGGLTASANSQPVTGGLAASANSNSQPAGDDGLIDRLKGSTGHLWDLYTNHYLPGIWDSVKELGVMAYYNNSVTGPIAMVFDHDRWVEHGPPAMAVGLKELGLTALAFSFGGGQIYAMVDPEGYKLHTIGFLKTTVNWEMWKKDPLRAAGQMVPDLVISAVSFGAGGGATKLATAANRAKNLSRLGKDASRLSRATRPAAGIAETPGKGLVDNLDDVRPPNWTMADEGALEGYTANNYGRINQYLRNPPRGFTQKELGGKVTDERIAAVKAERAAIDAEARQLASTLEKLPEWAGVSYRGVNFTDKVLAQFQKGAVVTDHGFASSSKNLATAATRAGGDHNPVIMRISGHSGRDISRLSPHNEAEVLFNKGTSFKVIGKTFDRDRGVWFLDLKEVP